MRSNGHCVGGFGRIFWKKDPHEPTPHILDREKNPSLMRFPVYDSSGNIRLYVPKDLISLANRMYLLDE